MTQLETLKKHFKTASSISQREAIMDYSIQSLTRCVTSLRRQGMAIHTVWKKHPITGQRYCRYTLDAPF
jgi:hypothetical protein